MAFLLQKYCIRWSHVGRRVVLIEPDISVAIQKVAASTIPRMQPIKSTPIKEHIILKGPLGEYSFGLHKGLQVKIEESKIEGEKMLRVALDEPVFAKLTKRRQKFVKGMWGTTVGILSRQAEGVKDGFTVPLRLVGVGYKASVEKECLSLKVGFSHPIVIPIPKDIKATTPIPTKILLFGPNYQKLTQFAARIRSFKKPEPYNGKGIFVGDETIRRKEGKKK